jgi:uncharacterized protein YlxW (UPF0749 family)
MFKKTDYIIIGVICFILGFAVISQYFASRNVAKLTQPETNEIMALEFERVAKNNASLKLQVSQLTKDYNDYKNSAQNSLESKTKINDEITGLNSINGVSSLSGQGVELSIEGPLSTANIVDLVDALKNIGAEAISINNTRIGLATFLTASDYSSPVHIVALGNSNVLESALSRKGGIIEQISSKNVRISVTKSDNLTIPAGGVLRLNYGKIIN